MGEGVGRKERRVETGPKREALREQCFAQGDVVEGSGGGHGVLLLQEHWNLPREASQRIDTGHRLGC